MRLSIEPARPFLYAGSKRRYLENIYKHLTNTPRPVEHFIDAFAGSSIVSINHPERYRLHMTVNEADEKVASILWAMSDKTDSLEVYRSIRRVAEIVEEFPTSKGKRLALSVSGYEKKHHKIALYFIRQAFALYGCQSPTDGRIKYGDVNRKSVERSAERFLRASSFMRCSKDLSVHSHEISLESPIRDTIRRLANEKRIANTLIYFDPPYANTTKAYLRNCMNIQAAIIEEAASMGNRFGAPMIAISAQPRCIEGVFPKCLRKATVGTMRNPRHTGEMNKEILLLNY